MLPSQLLHGQKILPHVLNTERQLMAYLQAVQT